MNAAQRLYQFVARSPSLWGVVACVGFYALIQAGPLDYAMLRRYCMSHPVEYAEVLLFAVGLAALVLKAIDMAGQFPRLAQAAIKPAAPAGPSTDAASTAEAMLAQLDELPESQQQDAYSRRLRGALEFARTRRSAEGLDDELKYLADAEATRIHNSHALFRVIVWAIPILGFLGTVIGITEALNAVDLSAPEQSMVHVLTGLGLKFDTTALALLLSMILMFFYLFVDRAETRLLDGVDRRVQREMAACFPIVPAGPDGHLVVVRRMAETMVHAAEQLVARQAELWRASMDAAGARWAELTEVAGQRLQAALAGAIGESLHQAHTEMASGLLSLQETVARQIELLEKTVKATGEVTALEHALNKNLAALAGAKHFEQTAVSLAAAVNLLSTRVPETDAPPPVKLDPLRKAARAA